MKAMQRDDLPGLLLNKERLIFGNIQAVHDFHSRYCIYIYMWGGDCIYMWGGIFLIFLVCYDSFHFSVILLLSYCVMFHSHFHLLMQSFPGVPSISRK